VKKHEGPRHAVGRQVDRGRPSPPVSERRVVSSLQIGVRQHVPRLLKEVRPGPHRPRAVASVDGVGQRGLASALDGVGAGEATDAEDGVVVEGYGDNVAGAERAVFAGTGDSRGEPGGAAAGDLGGNGGIGEFRWVEST